MEMLHRQLLGLATLIVMAVIIVACAPSIRRMRLIGETTRANRRRGLMIGLMATVAIAGLVTIIF